MSDVYRLPAEWESNEFVLMSWPHEATDWAYMLDSVQQCFIEIVKAIVSYARVVIVAPNVGDVKHAMVSAGVDLSRLILSEMPTNDTWARDFGMICTVSRNGKVRINDYKFNGWGLKFAACHDNLITRNLIGDIGTAKDAEYINRLNFVLEGGSIDSDGQGSVLTTSNCLLSPNRNGGSDRRQITDTLCRDFSCSRVLWVDHGDLTGDDTDSHIDTLARFLPGDIIACSTCDRPDDEHYMPLGRMVDQIKGFRTIDGTPYNIIELPIPEPLYDEEGLRLPATYANFLIINEAIILPVYGDTKYDTIAIENITAAAPQHKIIPVNCLPLIQQHGSLHCMTMQIPHGTLDR